MWEMATKTIVIDAIVLRTILLPLLLLGYGLGMLLVVVVLMSRSRFCGGWVESESKEKNAVCGA
jgi:ABC-type molybdate transport system permease subunit